MAAISEVRTSFKQRVHLQTCKSSTLIGDDKGSYALFYFIGRNVRKVFSELDNCYLSKELFSTLEKYKITIVAKAGTLQNRTSVCQKNHDPYYVRAKEIRSEMGRCFDGEPEGADRATRVAFSKLDKDPKSECFMVMVALKTYSVDAVTTEMEEDVSKHLIKKYGIIVSNAPGKAKQRDTTRWGQNTINIKVR